MVCAEHMEFASSVWMTLDLWRTLQSVIGGLAACQYPASAQLLCLTVQSEYMSSWVAMAEPPVPLTCF